MGKRRLGGGHAGRAVQGLSPSPGAAQPRRPVGGEPRHLPRPRAGGDPHRSRNFAAEALPHLDRLHALARALARPPLDPEELTQETFARACAAYHRFTPGSDMRAWLTTIMLNLVRGDARRRQVDLVPLSDVVVPAEPACDVAALRNLHREAVLDAVRALPPDFRLAIGLVDLVGLRVREAAEILDVPVGTVLSRLSRGRARLARRLSLTVGSDGEGSRQ